MRVLLLSWEYPPVVYGGLGRHVDGLARALARLGHDVVVVTQCSEGGRADAGPVAEVRGGVRVVRVPADPPHIPTSELVAWVLALGHALARGALAVTEDWQPDVVHAHDWVVAHPAKAVKDGRLVPLVATMHATEAGRHQGWLPSPTSEAIHTTEWWLTYEARRVITCSAYMREEVARLFALPADKVDIVANGIDPAAWSAGGADVAAARRRYAGDPLVVFIGRLEYEKGVQDLLRAVPRLRRRHPDIRLVVAGTGTYADELRDQAYRLRLGRAVTFTGYLDDRALAALAAAADCAVIPSHYEPFGLVALEAAAVATPRVVADTGGLAELVTHGRTGLRFAAGDIGELADAVSTIVTDQVLGRRLARAGRAALRRDHDWSTVARATVDVYARAVREERALAAAAPPLRLSVRKGNLLTGEADGPR